MPTEAEMNSPDWHPAEEMPQGPIPTGVEFRAMRAVLGLSLPELAQRTRLRVHRLAAIENRAAPHADIDEQVLHVVLMKSGVRWHPDLARQLQVAAADTGLQDLEQLLDHTGSSHLADLDEMAGTDVHLRAGPDHVWLGGPGVDVVMTFPFDIEDFWDVVEDIAAGPAPSLPPPGVPVPDPDDDDEDDDGVSLPELERVIEAQVGLPVGPLVDVLGGGWRRGADVLEAEGGLLSRTWFVSGEPAQLLLGVDQSSFALARPEGRWEDHRPVLHPVDQHVLDLTDLLVRPAEVAAVAAALVGASRAAVRWCVLCRRQRSAWHMDGDECHDCMSEHRGTVF
ncbi:hypothetical protein ASG36_18550 [Geodermatophilus sp. Leaf369]|nr:hypothetical protein ASG36_18550 [Geodermatophilus sp. Leaf369]